MPDGAREGLFRRKAAAPFSGTFFENLLHTDKVSVPMTSDLAVGLEQSYQEILKLFSLLGKETAGKVFRGSASYMTEAGKPVESDAARDLVRRAMAGGETLYVVAIGEITNIASAILMEPERINKIVVVWLAGQPMHWPHTAECNIGQDVLATQTILDCGVPLVPCMTVASRLTTAEPELTARLKGKSTVGAYLADTVIRQLSPAAADNMLPLFRLTYLKGADDYAETLRVEISFSGMVPSRIIWDISTVGYMIIPCWCPSTLIPTSPA